MPRLPQFHRFPCRLHPCIAVSSSALASTTTAFIAPTTTTTAPTTAGKPRMVYTLRPTHRFHSFPTNTSRPGSRSSAWAPLPSAENNYSPEAVAPDKRGCNSGPGRWRICFRRRRRAGGGNEKIYERWNRGLIPIAISTTTTSSTDGDGELTISPTYDPCPAPSCLLHIYPDSLGVIIDKQYQTP